MPEVYTHELGDEVSNQILELEGITTRSKQENSILRSKQCPNCSEPAKPEAKFCGSCRMILSYEAFEQTIDEKTQKEDELSQIKQQVQEIFNLLKGTEDPAKHTEFAEKLFKSGLIRPDSSRKL